ncbi:unnamed protein product [Phytophthora fragariaefolia]|uniref:Unnamed protein product n=1 Tax=Phytophthora fragariaefolia TaxID=1490495 RepID=A0A9W6XF89_9STRA|nr:unnamed protein product [Phytophthora fragariaefolia]
MSLRGGEADGGVKIELPTEAGCVLVEADEQRPFPGKNPFAEEKPQLLEAINVIEQRHVNLVGDFEDRE